MLLNALTLDIYYHIFNTADDRTTGLKIVYIWLHI